MTYILINLSLAGVLFFGNGLLGRLQYSYGKYLFSYGKYGFSKDEERNFSGNFVLKIVNPTIYLAVVSSLLDWMGQTGLCRSLWMLVPAYWVWRLVFILLRNFLPFTNKAYELSACLASILLSSAVFHLMILPLMDSGETIFIPLTELRSAIWFAIIAYVAKTFWDVCRVQFSGEAVYPVKKQKAIIRARYDAFNKKYSADILAAVQGTYPQDSPEKSAFVALVYAVMIYEDYNRPPFFRILEWTAKYFCPNRTMTLGIMQVATTRLISDRESIQLGVAKMLSTYTTAKSYENLYLTLAQYNSKGDYVDEVMAIYEELKPLVCRDTQILAWESQRI